MASPAAPKVRIGRLKLRVAGETAAAGREFAGEFGRHLAEQMPADTRGRLGHLRVRVGGDGRSSGGQDAATVAGAVVRRLSGGSDG